MTVASKDGRRPRRIAADEAHAWARNLRLGNPYAKLVLSMLTIYVNGEGSCFVSAAALAEDCELALETVRRRLAWLEAIGAIVRVAQWLDEHGRRNGDGRGKRTTDDIRLMINADPDEIEAKAHGNGDDDGPAGAPQPSEISPLPEGGAKSASPPVSPLAAPSLRTGPNDSEPEPEKSPPNPPSGGVREAIDHELEEDIDEFNREYPPPITNLPRLRSVLGAMERVTRRKVLIAAKGYAAYIRECERKGKPRAVKDAHRWVAGGLWQGYVPAGEKVHAASLVENVPIDSESGKALVNLHRIARLGAPIAGDGKVLLMQPLTPQALAVSKAPPESEWVLIGVERFNQVRAWDDLLSIALKGKPRPELVTTRNRGGLKGFMAPWPWPPLKDGTLSTTGPPTSPTMSEEDQKYITEKGLG